MKPYIKFKGRPVLVCPRGRVLIDEYLKTQSIKQASNKVFCSVVGALKYLSKPALANYVENKIKFFAERYDFTDDEFYTILNSAARGKVKLSQSQMKAIEIWAKINGKYTDSNTTEQIIFTTSSGKELQAPDRTPRAPVGNFE